MAFFLFWVLFSILVGAYASHKGLGGPLFFFISLILSPLIGFIWAAVSKPDKREIAAKSGMKKCPQCAEYVQGEALICRYCKYSFPEEVKGVIVKEYLPPPL